MSTFHGLEMAKQALFTQQSALYTTGHNIANANTEGYSRTRVNFEADTALPSASKNRMGIPGQIGTGVKAGAIERIRNEFLDVQFRGENSSAGYWDKRADALGRMENVLNDLNETGLSAVMDQFWSALQDLAVNPTSDGARSVVVQRGIALSDTFNYLNSSLSNIRGDLRSEITQTEEDVNHLFGSIQSLNERIKALEVNGYVPNDLYDARDRDIDALSRILPVEVTYEDSRKNRMDDPVPPGGNGAQDGTAVITMNGTILVNGVSLEDPPQLEVHFIGEENVEAVASVTIGGAELMPLSPSPEQNGTLNSLIKAYGYLDDSGTGAGDFLDRMNQLNEIRDDFIREFNSRHADGLDLNGEAGGAFFGETDGRMHVNEALVSNPDLIAAGVSGEGDGENAFDLSDVFEEAGTRDAYADLIGRLAVELQDAERMQQNTGVLLTQLEGSRQSVSSVSLDEEMTNMIKFQHAYNAAARSMTATDELLDRIINNMGLVGR
jgi:flagellar hook-associated protein 1 FlgK